MTWNSICVREACIDDVPVILWLIRELADFEHLLSSIETDEARLREHGFGNQPRFKILVAEDDGQVIGFLSYMIRYSIWGGAEFITLDDLFISSAVRGRGAGRALMKRLAEIAVSQNMAVRWELLPDNAPAKAFYTAIGAKISDKLIARWSVDAANVFLSEGKVSA